MADIVNMPKLGFDMAEGTLVRWVVGEGQQVNKGEVLAEIETDKATVEVESSYTGVVRQHLVGEDAVVPVGEPIAVIGEEGEQIDLDALLGEQAPEAEAAEGEKEAEKKPTAGKPEPQVEKPEKAPPVTGEGHLPEGVRASPLARRMAEEEGIDLSQVEGSGPQGRIVKADIESYVEAGPEPEERVPVAAPAVMPRITGEPREDQYKPLSRLRAAIGRRMVQSVNEAPHFYVSHEYDPAALMNLRKQVNALVSEQEKISVNDFIV
jgi:pyruvate dehydrogenase E2 component (dihydrolipoamide acetyltransferase)